MAQLPVPPRPAVGPSTFRDLFANMGDVYEGTYAPFLAEYSSDNGTAPVDLMNRTLTQLPVDQVPSVFIYQDSSSALRIVHHMHRVDTPFGQPPTPLTNAIIGFTSDVYQTNVQYTQLPEATFFSVTGDVIVPTIATMTALLAAAPGGTLGPFNPGDPDTEVINTRRAVPVPHAYVPLVTFRVLTPSEAWHQIGGQIIADNREHDCLIFLNFLRVATVVQRAVIRNQPNQPPATAHIVPFSVPMDGPILQHIHRKLSVFLPALFLPQQPPDGALQWAQATATIANGFQTLRADRVLEREADAAPKSFTKAFPAQVAGMHRLCQSDNNDNFLPAFWRFYATAKGKKATVVSALTNYVTTRARAEDSSQVLPILSTSLLTNIMEFQLGAVDLENITQGISPFLMCPEGYAKEKEVSYLTHTYLMFQGDDNKPTLEESATLVPSNSYSIPTDFHTLADFVGAYSIVWDVLIGPNHPLAISIRTHYQYWNHQARRLERAIPEGRLQNVVIIGTLRHMQLSVLRYVNDVLATEEDADFPVPNFELVTSNIDNRIFNYFPALPAEYRQERPATTLPPLVSNPVPPATPPPNVTRPAPTNATRPARNQPSGNEIEAPEHERNDILMEAFRQHPKNVRALRALTDLPKDKANKTTLCLSYHLRGICFDNCRSASTHRLLGKVEVDRIQAFLTKNQ